MFYSQVIILEPLLGDEGDRVGDDGGAEDTLHDGPAAGGEVQPLDDVRVPPLAVAAKLVDVALCVGKIITCTILSACHMIHASKLVD